MDKHLDLLDEPLESKMEKQPDHSRNLWDYRINVLLTVLPGALLFLGFIPEMRGIWFYAAVAMIPLGIYQVIGAAVGGARGNVEKGRYAVLAVLYVLFLIFGLRAMLDGIGFRHQSEWLTGILFVFVLPAIGAIYYTFLCRARLLENQYL